MAGVQTSWRSSTLCSQMLTLTLTHTRTHSHSREHSPSHSLFLILTLTHPRTLTLILSLTSLDPNASRSLHSRLFAATPLDFTHTVWAGIISMQTANIKNIFKGKITWRCVVMQVDFSMLPWQAAMVALPKVLMTI